jgi:hypothetical protein
MDGRYKRNLRMVIFLSKKFTKTEQNFCHGLRLLAFLIVKSIGGIVLLTHPSALRVTNPDQAKLACLQGTPSVKQLWYLLLDINVVLEPFEMESRFVISERAYPMYGLYSFHAEIKCAPLFSFN